MAERLKKELGLFQLTMMGVGIIIGAGIYALIGQAAGTAGNAVWLSFLISAVIAAFTGLSYMELSSMFSKAGGEYTYTKNAFGERTGFIVGWLILISSCIAAATVSLGFAGYMSSIIHVPYVATALALLVLLSFIIFMGIKQSAFIAILFTIVEVLGLLVIIMIGGFYFGSVDYFAIPYGFTGVISGAALVFFAFIGFEEITRLSEDTKNAQKIIPKALILSIIISSMIYVLVAVSAVSIVDWRILGQSKAPMADIASVAFGPESFIILAIVALFSTFNTAMLSMLAGSRVLYGMGEQKSLPKFFMHLEKKTNSPWIAIIAVLIISAAFALMGSINMAAEATNFTIFITFIAINITLIWLRYKQPNAKRGFKTPDIGKIPVLAVLGILTTFMLILHLSTESIIYGILLVTGGILIHEGYRMIRKK